MTVAKRRSDSETFEHGKCSITVNYYETVECFMRIEIDGMELIQLLSLILYVNARDCDFRKVLKQL